MDSRKATVRVLALVTIVVVGGAGSLGALLHAGRRTPAGLLILFIGWVLGPFVVLAWASIVATQWSRAARATLHAVALVIVVISLVVYGYVIGMQPKTPARFFLLVPLASLLLVAIVALFVHQRSRHAAGG